MKNKLVLLACLAAAMTLQNQSSAQVTGSGTVNYIPKFTPSTTNIGNSQIFDNGTNVGVGTASPTEKFHIYNGKLRITNAGTNALTFSTPGAWHEIAASNNLQFTLGGTMNMINGGVTRLFINSNGRVGVGGTTNPDEQLHLSTGKFKVGTSTNSLLVSNNTTYQEIAATDNLLLKASTAGMSFMTNNVLRMFITQTTTTGYTRVGINTTSPEEAMHIYNGSLKLTGTDPIHGAANIFWGGTPSVAPTGEWGLEYNASDTDPNKRGLNFWKPSGSSGVGFGNYFLFLGNNGNVGINTNNATAKLTVNGKTLIGDPAAVNVNTTGDYRLYVQKGILTEGIKVALTTDAINWSDYVFEPDYKLRSLQEVESFVKKNRHLPDVPSASDVYTNGLDLPQMDATLLRKVEELTLYIINLEKRIHEMEQDKK